MSKIEQMETIKICLILLEQDHDGKEKTLIVDAPRDLILDASAVIYDNRVFLYKHQNSFKNMASYTECVSCYIFKD